MMLRLLERSIYQEMGVRRFGRVQKELVSVLYSVAAYEVRRTKQGKAIYYMHHYILRDVSWNTIEGHGYQDMTRGSLHNHAVLNEVFKVLGE